MPNPFFYKKQMDTTYIDSATSFDTWVDQSSNSLDGTAGATNEPLFNFGNADSEYNPFLRFDGIDDVISMGDDSNLTFGNGSNDSSFSIELLIYINEVTTKEYLSKYDTNQREYYFDISDSGILIFLLYDEINNESCFSLSDAAISENQWLYIVITYDGTGGTTAADGLTFYIDGIVVASTANNNASYVAMSNTTGNYRVGKGVSLFLDGDVALNRVWNRELSAAEVLVQYNGGDYWQVAAPTADQWGSQTELMPNLNDRDFGGPSAWTDVDLLSYDEIGDLSINRNAEGQYCTLPVSSAPMTSGNKYRVKYDCTAGGVIWTLKDFTGVQTFGTITGEVANDLFIEFTVDAGITGGFRIVAGSAGAPTNLDNFSLIQIGCVAEYRLAHENAFSPFEFPKGRQLPVNFPIVPRQIVGVAGGGQTVVDDLGDADERWPINVLRVNATVRTNLLGFLQDTTVNYRANVFRFVEEDGTDNEVRLWEPFPLDFPRVPGSLYNLSMVVRKEIS